MIHLSIWLYGKPEWDLFTEEDGFINGDLFRGQADYLKEHLYRVADVVEKLKKNGWDCEGTLYTLELFKHVIRLLLSVFFKSFIFDSKLNCLILDSSFS